MTQATFVEFEVESLFESESVGIADGADIVELL
jgi:hypothetical protein